MDGCSPKSDELRIFVASFIINRAWVARDEVVGRSSISIGCVREKAHSDSNMEPNCAFVRCSCDKMRINKVERFSSGSVGWRRSKYTSIQGIMFASTMEAGHVARLGASPGCCCGS